MAEISAAAVKDLREKTGVGMMDCKKALSETNGDVDAAIELLRKKGMAKAAAKGSRVAAEGVVGAHVAADNKSGDEREAGEAMGDPEHCDFSFFLRTASRGESDGHGRLLGSPDRRRPHRRRLQGASTRNAPGAAPFPVRPSWRPGSRVCVERATLP